MASRPNVAVVMLTNRLQRGLGEVARQNGAYACFVKQFMSGEDLDRAIQRAMAFVEQSPRKTGGTAPSRGEVTQLCFFVELGYEAFTAENAAILAHRMALAIAY